MSEVEKSARVAATEASADGICWTFSPMVDIAATPAGAASPKEMGRPLPRFADRKGNGQGYQGDLSGKTDIMACVKHYAFMAPPKPAAITYDGYEPLPDVQ